MGDILTIELLGAFLGALVSIAFLPPKTLVGLARRSVVAMICGPIFAHVVRDYVNWPPTVQYRLSSAAFTAGISWWAIGIGTSILRAWANKKAGIEDS